MNCTSCGQTRPLEQFGSASGGKRRRQCKRCLATAARWRKHHHERVIQTLRSTQLRRYGFTDADYSALLARQGGVCAICGTGDPGRGNGGQRQYFSIDHDHLTGRVRGLLCDRCNRVLGRMDDSPDLLRKAAMYLEAQQLSDGYQ